MKRKVHPLYFYVTVSLGILVIGFGIYTYHFIQKPISKTPSPVRIIILSPHYDDGVLSLGGTLHIFNTNASVVTFLGGIPTHHGETQWDRKSGFTDKEQAVADRIIENNNALQILSSHVVNLPYLDYQYRHHKTEDKSLIRASFEQEIEKILEEDPTTPIYMYGPAIFGKDLTHPDHRLLHTAYTTIIKKYKDNPNMHFFFYEDFPYVYGYMHRNNDALVYTLAEETDLKLHEEWLSLSAQDVNAKSQALRQYASQDKAFASMSFNVRGESARFMHTRCKKRGIPWCEVVYRVLP